MSNLSSNLQEEEDLFYFESDHLALKGNKDYSEVLKTLFILEAQRERAIKDYNTVVELHKKCLENPVLYIEKLKNNDSLGIPDLQRITEVPVINWSKYNVQIPEDGIKFLNTSKNTNVENVKVENIEKSKNTHNKAWTTEEQKRLEELLAIYPPEPIELRRFKKIAAALGNRTVQQVTSRVQKYFLKLYKAGLPIPGRIPKSAEKHKKSLLHKHQRHNHYLWKPTTFFPELNIPVVMGENDDVPGPSTSSKPITPESYPSHSGNYLLPSGYKYENKVEQQNKNELDVQLELLKRIRKEKQREESNKNNLFQHSGYQCDFCKENPIIGSRWHCETCENVSIDFCTDCLVSQMYSENRHPLLHKLIIIQDDRNVETFTNSESESLSESESEKSQVSDESETSVKTNDNVSSEEQFKEVCTVDNLPDMSENDNHSEVNGTEEGDFYGFDLSSSNYTTVDSYLPENNFNFNIECATFSDMSTIYDNLHSNLLLDDT